VLPVVAVAGGNGEDVHVAVHYDAGSGALEAIEVTDDVGEMSLGAYGPGWNSAVMEIVAYCFCCMGCVSRWVGGGGADEGLEEGDMAFFVGFDCCEELLFVTLVHYVILKETQFMELCSVEKQRARFSSSTIWSSATLPHFVFRSLPGLVGSARPSRPHQ